MRFTIVGMIAVLFASECCGAVTMSMDAAEKDRFGVDIVGAAGVRFSLDNTAGDADVTDVLFKAEIHGGTVNDYTWWAWSDATSPWFGARNYEPISFGSLEYSMGMCYYSDNPYNQALGRGGYYASAFQVDPTPDAPEDPDDPATWDDYILIGTVPAGWLWDIALKFVGDDVDLFSTAAGEVVIDGVSTQLYDSDPLPQTVPEPASVLLMLIGALTLRRRHL